MSKAEVIWTIQVQVPVQIEPKKVWKCEECGIEVEGQVKLKNHKRSHKTQACKYCEIVFNLSSLDKHMKSCAFNAKKETFSCDECDYISTFKLNLHRHKKMQNTNKKKRTLKKKCLFFHVLSVAKFLNQNLTLGNMHRPIYQRLLK